VCDVTNKQKRNNATDNETSSKLWYYHLGYISRGGGGMERLIKEEIVTPLDFSDLDHCYDRPTSEMRELSPKIISGDSR
jgi:hypothetical protein